MLLKRVGLSDFLMLYLLSVTRLSERVTLNHRVFTPSLCISVTVLDYHLFM